MWKDSVWTILQLLSVKIVMWSSSGNSRQSAQSTGTMLNKQTFSAPVTLRHWWSQRQCWRCRHQNTAPGNSFIRELAACFLCVMNTNWGLLRRQVDREWSRKCCSSCIRWTSFSYFFFELWLRPSERGKGNYHLDLQACYFPLSM